MSQTITAAAPALFNRSYFGNQVPWYGPFVNNGEDYVVVSSSLAGWPPDVNHSLTCWLFDENGEMVCERVLWQDRPAGEPITVNLRSALGDVALDRGMIAMLVRPALEHAEVPQLAATWVLRFCGSSGVREVIATGSSRSINYPELTGRRATFRLFSGALVIDDGWRPLAVVMNASADPEYATTLRLNVHAYNERGESVDATGAVIRPFGSAWIDIQELFGDRLRALLGAGRGAYVIESDDAAGIGYHLLYHPETGRLAGDHTRPLLAYVPRGYGIGTYTTNKPTVRDYVRHARFISTLLLKR